MRTKLLLLTKSNKNRHDGAYGKCIAGLIRGPNGLFKWVRLVADRNGDSILEKDFPFNPLDVIEVDIYPCPLNNHIENHTYSSPRKVAEISLNQLKKIFRQMPHSFFGSMSDVFIGTPKNSLTILLATNLHFYWLERNGEKHQKVDFKMGKNTATKVSMTDSKHYTDKKTSEEKHIPLAICVASLPDHPPYNKFIASIFPIDSYEQKW